MLNSNPVQFLVNASRYFNSTVTVAAQSRGWFGITVSDAGDVDNALFAPERVQYDIAHLTTSRASLGTGRLPTLNYCPRAVKNRSSRRSMSATSCGRRENLSRRSVMDGLPRQNSTLFSARPATNPIVNTGPHKSRAETWTVWTCRAYSRTSLICELAGYRGITFSPREQGVSMHRMIVQRVRLAQAEQRPYKPLMDNERRNPLPNRRIRTILGWQLGVDSDSVSR